MRGNSLRSNPRPANSMEQDSFDSFDDEDMLVMSTNSALSINSVDDDNGGAPNNLGVGGNDRSADDDLPKSVVVTNVSLDVFDNEESKVSKRIIMPLKGMILFLGKPIVLGVP